MEGTLVGVVLLASGCVTPGDFDRFGEGDGASIDGGGPGDGGGGFDAAERDGGADAGRDSGPPVMCTDRTMCDDGDPCTADECVGGECDNMTEPDATDCGGGMSCCGGSCRETLIDPAACGESCRNCGDHAICTAGACDCLLPYRDCDGDGLCETNTDLDPMNCGACDRECTRPTPSCIGGTCVACSRASDCPDDGLACTGSPTCGGAGLCRYDVTTGCLIAGSCVAEGATDPTGMCRSCNPSVDPMAYTVSPDGASCNDGVFCNGADSCAGGACTGHAGYPCGGDDCDESGDRCIACGDFGEPCCGGSGCVVPGGGCCECYGGLCLECGTHSDCPGPFCPGGGSRWECEGGRCVFGPCG
jgi:hypothetical protein